MRYVVGGLHVKMPVGHILAPSNVKIYIWWRHIEIPTARTSKCSAVVKRGHTTIIHIWFLIAQWKIEKVRQLGLNCSLSIKNIDIVLLLHLQDMASLGKRVKTSDNGWSMPLPRSRSTTVDKLNEEIHALRHDIKTIEDELKNRKTQTALHHKDFHALRKQVALSQHEMSKINQTVVLVHEALVSNIERQKQEMTKMYAMFSKLNEKHQRVLESERRKCNKIIGHLGNTIGELRWEIRQNKDVAAMTIKSEPVW